MNIVQKYLQPGCYSNNPMSDISGIVMHYASAVNVTPDDPFNVDSICKIFEDYIVSAHFMIDRSGTIYELVPLPKKAYHAGKSIMDGRRFCNNYCIGIELVGGKQWDYTKEQLDSAVELCVDLCAKYAISTSKIQGHDEVRANWRAFDKSPPPKPDPGKHFPWPWFRETILNQLK